MLHDILDDDHIQRHPPLIRHYTKISTLLLIWTLLVILTFNLIAGGFYRTFATGAACQQRTLTLPSTCSCPTLGLASVLMLRSNPPEFVLFLDFLGSNIPRYFCFARYVKNVTLKKSTDDEEEITQFMQNFINNTQNLIE